MSTLLFSWVACPYCAMRTRASCPPLSIGVAWCCHCEAPIAVMAIDGHVLAIDYRHGGGAAHLAADIFAEAGRSIDRLVATYAGKLEGEPDMKLLAFANTKATDENNQPHIRLYLAPAEDSQQQQTKDSTDYSDIPF